MALEYGSLLVEIDKLERILGDVERILKRADIGRKLELVGLRRRLSAQMASVRATGEAALPATNGAELATEYRARFSTMVRAVALHQAGWPAVTINEEGEGYLKSATAVARTIRDFVTWTRLALAAVRRD